MLFLSVNGYHCWMIICSLEEVLRLLIQTKETQLVNALWAKKTSDDDGERFLPLITHLTDTANVMNWLYVNWISDGVRKQLEAAFSPTGAHKLVRFLGFIHDWGKSTPAFQTKKAWNHDVNLDNDLFARLNQAGFDGVERAELPDSKESPHNIAGEALLEQVGVPVSVAAIVGAHHGRTLPKFVKSNIDDYPENYFQSDMDSKIQAPWRAVQKALLNRGLAVAGYANIQEIPAVSQPLAVLLEGLLIMADWLASTEYLSVKRLAHLMRSLQLILSADFRTNKDNVVQLISDIQRTLQRPEYFDGQSALEPLTCLQELVTTDGELSECQKQFDVVRKKLEATNCLDRVVQDPLFPLVPLNYTTNIDTSSRFKRAMMNWNWSDNWVPERLSADVDPYQIRWGFQKTHEFQKHMTRAIEETVNPGMVIVEAGMGSGKTEIALLAAEQVARKTGRNGVFMGLPTQATSDAMFSRVEKWVAWQANRQHRNLAINLSHGKSAYNELYQSLQHSSNIDAFDAEDDADSVHAGSVGVDTWFTGKKSILTPFSVGTIDNLLLMGLQQKHLFLRHFGFSNKVIVIDEAHSFDSYMNSYLDLALTWLGAYHVPVIILSATLPKEKRNSLIEAYLTGKYGCRAEGYLKAPDNWKEATAYPLLSIIDGQTLKQVTDNSTHSGQISQTVVVQRLTGDDKQLVGHVLKQLEGGGVAGIIVNTVKRAQKLAQIVAKTCDIKLMVLHSAFLAPDRTAQENELQRLIGKNGERPTKMIVIGTQVLEQSLDVDFDVMYTDIAPIDLILQRVGRLHRHSLDRPMTLIRPQLFVLGTDSSGNYGDANRAIYGDYLLTKTDHFLNDKITLPDDISPLVQRVYDKKTDQQIQGIAPLREAFKTKIAEQEEKAAGYQIYTPRTGRLATLLNWLPRLRKTAAVDSVHASAMVRDIQETLEVILVRQTVSGKYLLDGRPVDQVTSKEISQQVVRIPAAVTLGNMDSVIKDLETQTRRTFSTWRDEMWLRGVLALVLDEHNATTIQGWHLSYSPSRGLSYEREVE